MLYLAAALLVGLGLALRTIWPLPAFISALNPVFFHLIMVGWVTQLIFGVVYWMFPRASRERPHGNETLWWATFWLLNVGLLLRIVAEPLLAQSAQPVWGWALALSALLQWSAGLIFVLNTWNRVKGH